jgi:small subunit ribosomal protein S2
MTETKQLFTMRQLLEAGVHYGHSTRRWNPKMAKYIFGDRNGIHIINLDKTAPLLNAGLKLIQDTVTKGGRVLFVGTKGQASEILKDAAKKCGQYYVNHRWLGGMMTNWKTVNQSIKRLKEMEERLAAPEGLTKKETLGLERKVEKLELAIGGVREMGGLPDVIFVIDTNKESLAIQEATRLKIPIVGIVDTNSDPSDITHPIPGNDDAIRSIQLYCDLASKAVIEGLQKEMRNAGIDMGAQEEAPEQTATA